MSVFENKILLITGGTGSFGNAVLNIAKGLWHSLKCIESGTILLEAKDGPYHPLEDDEIWKL